MKRISIQDVTKNFFSLRRGKVQALKGINLDIDAGSFFVLLGPSGCGKSTLLNIIAGIEKPTSGSITIGDQTAVSTEERIFRTPRQRDIAMVFQSYALYPHMTVFDNIAFPLTIAKTRKEEIKKRVRDVAGILEIETMLDAKPGELSGGQRQRVALGRAIVRQPNVLLLDEPLSNLDALLRITMRAELKQVQRRIGVTTIYVTHDQVEAMSLGDRIAVLRDGRVIQVGTPEEIYDDPANEFVGRFVGTPPMNMLPGTLLSEVRGAVDLPDADLHELTVGLRPEHLQLTSPGEGLLNGQVRMVGSQGSEKIVYVTIGDHEVLVRTAPDSSVSENADISITFDPRRLFLFQSETGERLQK